MGKVPESCIYHTATLLPDGRVLVVAGTSDLKTLVWDPTTNAFSPAGSLGVARSGHTATLLPDGRVLVVGGEDRPNPTFTTAELWAPRP